MIGSDSHAAVADPDDRLATFPLHRELDPPARVGEFRRVVQEVNEDLIQADGVRFLTMERVVDELTLVARAPEPAAEARRKKRPRE